MKAAFAAEPSDGDGRLIRRILLMGSPRSGTTWIGRMLGYAPDAVYVDEPDLVEAPATGPVGQHGFGPYPVLSAGEKSLRAMRYAALWDLAFADASPRRKAFLALGRAIMPLPAPIRDPVISSGARLVARVRPSRRHIVAKSVVGQFSLEWLVARYQPQMLLIQRHPLNVVASWLTLPEPLYGLPENAVVRERVVDAHRLPAPPRPGTQLTQVAWCVGLLTAVLHLAAREHDDWLVITHEEMCDDPVQRLRALANRLGLGWTDGSDRAVQDSQRPGTGRVTNRIASELPEKWRSVLSASDAAEVMRVLVDFPGGGWIRSPATMPTVAPPP
jgi:hypothetical protein